ncbi:hypothetical protein [Vibrio phage J14]|nr:hypothetical protein [Vibrio phage J14]
MLFKGAYDNADGSDDSGAVTGQLAPQKTPLSKHYQKRTALS